MIDCKKRSLKQQTKEEKSTQKSESPKRANSGTHAAMLPPTSGAQCGPQCGPPMQAAPSHSSNSKQLSAGAPGPGPQASVAPKLAPGGFSIKQIPNKPPVVSGSFMGGDGVVDIKCASLSLSAPLNHQDSLMKHGNDQQITPVVVFSANP
ncbi:hypothetical protein JCM33374_g2357 [Metschnikowia sp. JCM 33374]|nr:hypothetical protein JCM33374_g2357 [Metschnikowia sp. JCM 33374]